MVAESLLYCLFMRRVLVAAFSFLNIRFCTSGKLQTDKWRLHRFDQTVRHQRLAAASTSERRLGRDLRSISVRRVINAERRRMQRLNMHAQSIDWKQNHSSSSLQGRKPALNCVGRLVHYIANYKFINVI